MSKKGRVVVLEKVRVWVESMAKGGPVKDELEAKKVAVPHKNNNNNNNNSSNGDNNVKKEEVKKNEGKKGFKVISLIEKFNCRARDLFEILMDENRWRGFTQSNARISKEVGGEFSIFDGSVTGKNLELDEGKLIVQGWRFGSWPDGIESMVRIMKLVNLFECLGWWVVIFLCTVFGLVLESDVCSCKNQDLIVRVV